MMPSQCTQLPLPEEEWRPVVGWEGWYEVSSLGRVRRVRAAMGTYPMRILRTPTGGEGYPEVTLWRLGKHSTMCVHVLVALAFLGPRPQRHQVNHKDGHKTNNHRMNLEWTTHQGNAHHALATGLLLRVNHRFHSPGR